MKRKSRKLLTGHSVMSLLLVAMMLMTGFIAAGQAPTAFTYQGRLTDAGSPAGGAFDFEFKLFDGSGSQLGSSQEREDVTVTNGVFLVRLDFGVSPFIPGAAASTLEIGVRPGTSVGAYTTLSPRQPITATPYAVQTINAEMLGGVPADQYVKTDDPRLTDGGPPAPGSEHYIQNTTTQQPNVNFNIGGNGLFGGQVGIGTQTPSAGIKLEVSGDTLITTAAGNRIQFGTPNVETGMTLRRPGIGRADVRFDGATLKLVAGADAGPPGNASGVAVSTSGQVGIGTDFPTVGRLHVMGGDGQPGIYSQSPNRGLWGKSTGSSYGVYGESVDGIGMQGVSTNNVGTTGASTSHVGVYGSTAAADVAKPGVLGSSTGVGGVGVRGDGTTGVYGVSPSAAGVGVTGQANNTSSIGVFGTAANGTGVRGESANALGYGLYAKNIHPLGMALGVEGNAVQNRDKGGLVKAMIYVREDSTVARCFNSQRQDGGAGLPPSGNTGCGFTVQRVESGDGVAWATVGFNFEVGDRFWSATVDTSTTENVGVKTSGAGNSIIVRIYLTDERLFTDVYRNFILIVY